MICNRGFSKTLLLATLFISGAATAQAQTCAQLRAEAPGIISVHCGQTPSATFAEDGSLWVAFEQDQHVYVVHSGDRGATFSPPLQVNAEPENIEHHGEGRPKLLVSSEGHLLLSWTKQTSANFTGEIRFARSTDKGASFEAPRTINDDGLFTGHRFDALFLSESGKLYLSWLDKRDMEASHARNEVYHGAALYYAVSDDMGATFSVNHRVAANSCECCRIAMAPHGDDEVAVLWRHIYGEDVRDHALAVLNPTGAVSKLARATLDNWHIAACPHHGPTLAQGSAAGTYHMSWFSGGTLQSGIHYGRYDVNSGTAEHIVQVDAAPGAGHPFLAHSNDTLFLVWKGFTGSATELRLMTSQDEGASWGPARTLHSTQRASDHPLLVTAADGSIYLSWATEEFGYLFEKLN